jgi:branched-chain amino acid transport system ATP-binding protein/branched-chain amino acid transport system permease protein
VRATRAAGLVVLLAAGLALPAVVSGYVVNIVTQICLYAYLASAWNVMALSGLVSLGHAAFFGIGGYTMAWLFLTWGVTPAIGWMGGVVLAMALALAVYWVTFRCGLRGIYFGGLTLVLAESLRFAAINSPALGRSQGLELLGFHVASWLLYALALLLMAGGMLLTWWILDAPLGYRLQAIRDNEVAAESMGVDTFRLKLTATLISAALTALGGTVHALLLRFVEPESDFGIGVSLNLVLGAFLGGTGTILGPAVGIAVLFGLREAIAIAGEQLAVGTSSIYAGQQILYGLILMVVVLLLPDGLVRRVGSLLTRWRLPSRSEPAPRSAESPVAQLVVGAIATSGNGHADAGVPLLEVAGVRKAFAGLVALRDVTFEVRAGEILGIIGPNGAGKTTLFNVISGVHPPTAGAIRFKGRDVTGISPSRVCHRGVARTFQVVRPFAALSVEDNVVIGALARARDLRAARQRAAEVLDFVGLDARRRGPAGALTLQERKLLEFARALATAPELLLLDEVMAGLNLREQERVGETIRRIRAHGVTLLVIEHVMRAIMSLSDRVLVLNQGAVLVEGKPAAIAHDARVIEAYLGTPGGALA